MLQTQALSYYTALISEIKNTLGYTDEAPVVFVNEFEKKDKSFIGTDSRFDEISLTPYCEDSLINDYNWRDFMRQWCGFDTKNGDEQ